MENRELDRVIHRTAHAALYVAVGLVIRMGVGHTSGEDLPYPMLGLTAALLLILFLFGSRVYNPRGGNGDLR